MLQENGFVGIALFMIYLIVSQNTLHGCRTTYRLQVFPGHRCRSSSDAFFNASAMPYPQCLWHCLRRHNCLMLMHNTQYHYCILLNDSCIETELEDSVTVRYLGPLRNENYNGSHVCLQWRTNEGDWPQNVVVVNDVVKDSDHAVARISIGDILLPGGYKNGETKSTIDGNREMADTGEYLLVQPTCSVMWLA